jgi:hypothetical protein
LGGSRRGLHGRMRKFGRKEAFDLTIRNNVAFLADNSSSNIETVYH